MKFPVQIILAEAIHSATAGAGSRVLLWLHFLDGNAETIVLRKMWFVGVTVGFCDKPVQATIGECCKWIFLKKNLKFFFSQVLLKDKELFQAYRRMDLLVCFEIFHIRYLWEALIAPPSLLLLLETGSHLWHSRWEWCRQGENSLPYTQLPSGTGDCALQHKNGTKWIAVVTVPLVAPKAHLEQQYTEMRDLQAIISPVMSSCFRGLNTLQTQVLENEDFIK